MRIEFITQQDPIYILPFFEEFIRNYSSEFTIARISTCKTMGNRPRLQLLRELAALYRPWGLARLLGRVAASRLMGVVSLPKDAPRYFRLMQLCRSYGIECDAIGNPNAPQYVAETAARGCDLIVSVACPYILKRELLSLPPLGCINIHHARLPRYKGMMPTFWQLYQGESQVGLTIHSMSEKLDEGHALLQEDLPIEEGESLDRIIRRSKRHASHCLAHVLRQLQANALIPEPVDNTLATYFTFPTLREIREFQQRGLRAI